MERYLLKGKVGRKEMQTMPDLGEKQAAHTDGALFQHTFSFPNVM